MNRVDRFLRIDCEGIGA